MVKKIFKEPKYQIGDKVQINIAKLKEKLNNKKINEIAFENIIDFNKTSLQTFVITRISNKFNSLPLYNLNGEYMLVEDEITRLERSSQIYYLYRIQKKYIEIFSTNQKYKAINYCKVHKDWDFIEGLKIQTIQDNEYKLNDKFKFFKFIDKQIN